MAYDPHACVEALLVVPSGTDHVIPPSGATIGRRSDVDVVLHDPSISRRHAQIVCRGGAFYIIDLGSSNGTTLNGEPLTHEAELSDGDVIQLGAVTLTFRLRPQRATLAGPPAAASAYATPGPEHATIAVGRAGHAAGRDPAGRPVPRLAISATDPVPGAAGAVAQLRLAGVLDVESVELFNVEVERLLEAGVVHCTLDLGGLEYLDSAGLSALVALRRRVYPLGGSVRLQRLQPAVRGLLELTHLDRIFAVQ